MDPQPSTLLQVSVKISLHGMNIGLPIGKESPTKSQKFFPLELRAKTTGFLTKPHQLLAGTTMILLNTLFPDS